MFYLKNAHLLNNVAIDDLNSVKNEWDKLVNLSHSFLSVPLTAKKYVPIFVKNDEFYSLYDFCM